MSRLHRVGDRVLITRGLSGGQHALVAHVDAQMRRYRLSGHQGEYDEESLVLVEEVKPSYFVFKALYIDGQGSTRLDNMVVYNCILRCTKRSPWTTRSFGAPGSRQSYRSLENGFG